MVGFPTDGGLLPSGVTAMSALGLSAVWRSLDILSNGVSQLPWRERRGNADLPLSRLVTRPQSTMTRREWVSKSVSTLALYDVCYYLKAGGTDSEGVPLGLWYVDPNIVQAAEYDAWSMVPPTRYYVNGNEIDADRLVVLHRSPQPGIDDALGGVIRLARVSFAAALAAEAYASRYWQAGGSPTTYLKTEAKLDTTQADDLMDRWRSKRSLGPDYPPVMSSGIEAVMFGADPTQQAAVEARREMVADVGRYFGIPTRTLNAPAGDTETYATAQEGNQDLIRYTFKNYIGALEDAISDQLPGGRRMEMDIYPLTQGTQLQTAQALQLATASKAWMAVDEARELLGLGPVESPDTLNPPPPVSVMAAQGANE